MIVAAIEPNKQRLSVSLSVFGHSGYAPSGSDIVCAWVSALVQTFAATAELMQKNGDLQLLECRMDLGGAVIRCQCDTEEAWKPLCVALGFTQLGLLLLERDYPQYIKVNGA